MGSVADMMNKKFREIDKESSNQPLVHSRTIHIIIYFIPIGKTIKLPVTPSDDRHEIARRNLEIVREEYPESYAEIITTELVK